MRKPVMPALLNSALILSLLLTGCAHSSGSATPTGPSGQLPIGGVTTPAPGNNTDPGEANPSAEAPKPGEAGGQTSTEGTAEPTEPPDPTEPAESNEPQTPARTMPNPVRGLHLSGWYAGSPDLVWPLLDWAWEAGINTIVLDLKAEDGYLSWESDIPLAQEIGANMRKIADLKAFVEEAHDRGFWVAGRIVVMNDQWLYKGRPEWAIPGFDGGAYSFMDPANENVWKYNIDVAKEAIAAGVDEIQFDYIRYSEHLREGYNGHDTTAEQRTKPINDFLRYAMTELKPLGVVVGADVFGLTTSVAEGDDMEIGQDYRQIAEIVDYIAPMVYPSHYAPYTYGLENPNANPYETVYNSMKKALERTEGLPIEKHRPWIQDFSLGGISYGPAEVMAQVQALKDLGIESFMLWDPSNKYTREVSFR
ncbi:MAG: putative glycoside hydrolase [Symbiobacterium sp.]|uniref:putative glycoside hydrolase n=1 Tax=Symbiobacterium sp. TaxID=1971213 RepID=UPI003463B296